jgi:hypothetical protein
MRVEMLDQKRALNPKAASGKAVAVPRWSGKLEAAGSQSISFASAYIKKRFNLPVLMAAPKAEQPPVPVKKAKKHMKIMGTEPGPLW